MNKSEIYDYDITIVKQYGDNILKVVNLNACRKRNVEMERKYIPKNSVNEKKLDNNIARAKARVKEYVLCNSWQYWCTFTISPERFDRYNLGTYQKAFSEFLHNFNKKRTSKITFVLVPEMHEDGAWHMHGLLSGFEAGDLYENRFGYLGWKAYEERFGYISMSPVRDVEKTASYALKYMTKDKAKNVAELGGHLYYSSHGLKTAETIFRGRIRLHTDWDWEHPDGFCRIKTFDNRVEEISEYVEVVD